MSDRTLDAYETEVVTAYGAGELASVATMEEPEQLRAAARARRSAATGRR